MGGVLKNGGLIRVQPHEKPAFDSMAPDNTFKSDSFENTEVSGYGNNGGVMRRTADNSVKANAEKEPEKPPVNDKSSFKTFTSNLSGVEIRSSLKTIPGNTADNTYIQDEIPESRGESEEVLKSRVELLREYENIRNAMINEGEQAKREAESWAAGLIEKTQKDIRLLYDNTHKEAEEIKRSADEEGYKEGYGRGFEEGDERGYNEGYNKGLRKCKETLKELVTMLEQIPEQKDIVFKQYERELFDAIFTIANKITVESLRQKDKNVIQKMLREAAKGFRNSEYVKISLSKLDADEMGNAEMDSLRAIFRENQHVEFEIVKDAPEGTLILDNGSEITDAGIATQLMMIEKLGKGKFRDKNTSDDV